MQSQQKRVKWSRGETAEAVEERTDTGITQASVEFMENCIPDIYGNVSRRPALKLFPHEIIPTYNYTWSTPVADANLGNRNWLDLAYGNSLFVALGYTGYISTSSDGSTWAVSAQDANLGNNRWTSLAYDGTKFVALSYIGYISTSTDGTTWTTAVQNANLGNNYWLGITYGDNKFVAIGRDGHISTSDNGTDWSVAVQLTDLGAKTWQKITYGDDRFVAISSLGYTAVSYNGLSWVVIDTRNVLGANSAWHDIIFVNGRYIAFNARGETSQSTDGIHWSNPVAEFSTGGLWQSIAFGNNYYVVMDTTDLTARATATPQTAGAMGFQYNDDLKVYPFYISENDYILCGFSVETAEFIRIKDKKIVAYYNLDYPLGFGFSNVVSFAQQNNYAIVGTEGTTWILKMALSADGVNFTPDVKKWNFTAGWYAPFGTTTATVGTAEVPGLNFNSDGTGFHPYIETALDGSSTVYSYVLTGLSVSDTTNVNKLKAAIPRGSIITFANNGAYFRVENYTDMSGNLAAYGSLLTPVADATAQDSKVSVEKGYISLQPSITSVPEYSFPRPTVFAFSDQRLWTGGWHIDSDVKYSLVIGSQIARYTDLKNDYNQANEPITLDIFTKYKEQVLHLIDYNGLKIFTNSHEYAYQNGGAVIQSANGSLASCEPIVFESLCLYVDSTGNQVRAMQYEFQTSVYESSCINQVAPHDLVWYPISMAQYEDKVNSTGKYLFVTNTTSTDHPKLAVCNFVPANQANIWSRWSTQNINIGDKEIPMIYNVVNMKAEPIFLVTTREYTTEDSTIKTFLKPAFLDFSGLADIMGSVENNKLSLGSYDYIDEYGNMQTDYMTLTGVTVNVYANGVFQWQDTLTSTGELTKDTSALTNVSVGLPINSVLRSHPIDVGGKTKSVMKRIGKAQMSVHGTDADTISINGKTGYMNPRIDHICFYGVTGMKDEIKYIITNKNGAMFHLESLLMNIEYGTLDS